jgi:MoaA/NifB/PqqE/SkfB family radical SAM enzyme
MNKTYCSAAFSHIYSNSSGKYKLCCYNSDATSETGNYDVHTTSPFEFFLSTKMEDIRNRMLEGKKIGGCKKCYDIEKMGHQSPRERRFNKRKILTEVGEVELKLRVFGNHCNLSCYMCIPFNSSTRAKELKEIGIYDEISKGKDYEASIKYKDWKLVEKNILDHIHLVEVLHITGGEPFLLPKHYEFLKKIPDQYAKNIILTYDTNLTVLEYKGQSVFDYADKFKEIKLGVSCDHFGEKLEWIRYPINYEQFENNIRTVQSTKNKNISISALNVTTSILNVEDLYEIREYYLNNFNIECKFYNVVNTPLYLNIKNHPLKNELYEKYKHDFAFDLVCKNLKMQTDIKQWNYGLDYLTKLDQHRNTDYKKFWPTYNKIEMINAINL